MKSVISLVAARVWMNVCAVVTFIVVSHFLGPAEFGMFALASSISILPNWLVGAGACEFVLGRDPEGRHEDTAWTLSVLSGLAAALVLLGFGAGSYIIFHSGEAFIIFAAFALGSLMWGLCATLESRLLRDNRGGAVAVIGIVAETVGLAMLFVSLAWGAGIYALVISRLAGGTISTIGFFRATRHPFHFAFERQAARDILHFSTGIVGSRSVGWANAYGSDVIIGYMLALTDVGLFRMGMRIYQAAHAVVIQAPAPTIFAAMGHAAARHSARMHVVAHRATILQLALTFPLFVGLAASAGLIINIALQPVWRDSGSIVAITCLSVPGMILLGTAVTALNASGRSHALFMFTLLTTPIGLLAMFAGAAGGPIMVAGVKAVVALIIGVAAICVIPDITRKAGTRLLAATARITAAGAIMFVCCYGSMLVIEHWTMWLRVPLAAIILLAGLVIYAGVLRILAPESFRVLKVLGRTMVRRLRHKHAAPRAAA